LSFISFYITILFETIYNGSELIMNNYFLEVDSSSEEQRIFKVLQESVCPGIIKIQAEEYSVGRLFLLAQSYAQIKGKFRLLNTGIRLGRLLKPEQAVIFHKKEDVTIAAPYLVDIEDEENFIANARQALGWDGEISWPELARSFSETYHLLPHDDRGLKSLWKSQRKQVKEMDNIKDAPKEILFVDDEYRYFQKEMETVIKRRYPSWTVLWAEDESQAEKIIAENVHLDMVILDLEFRGDDIEGKELLHKLRGGKQKGFFFPIIVFSRCRDLDIIEELIKPQEVGADDYISKFDILEKNNFNLFVSLMARHMNQYEQVHDMQKILAPDVAAQIGAFQIHGLSRPFVEVGGDVIDYVAHNGALTIFLADAISHGFDAGLLSGMFKASLKTKLLESASLIDSINCVDTVLCRIKNKSEKRIGFVLTAALLQFRADNIVKIVNAGHLPVLHYRSDLDQLSEISLLKRDRALGMVENGNVRQVTTLTFSKGDLFVLFSDGISETKGKNEKDFDISGVKKIVFENRHKSLKKICQTLFEAVRKHGRQTDDRTLMLIRVND
jgi:serine phosphatase RsbU (regulator of sigma subunit)